MATAAPIKLSGEVIAEFLQLEDRRRELNREAAAIEARTKPIATALKELLTKSGKESAVRHGYRLTFIDGPARVAWKDEFVRIAGPDEATRLQGIAPKSKLLDVKPAKAA